MVLLCLFLEILPSKRSLIGHTAFFCGDDPLISQVGKLLLGQDEVTVTRVARSLKRVFVGDSTFRGDGLRRIWHRGENTTDVVSWVDRQGQIMRQEFTFGGLVVRWERERGVISGSEQGGGEHSVPASKTVEEWGSNLELFSSAFALLCSVPQSDFYLRHLMHRLAEIVDQDPPSDRETTAGEVTMTHILKSRSLEQRWEMVEEKQPESHLGLWIAVAGLGITLFIGAFWYVVSH